MLYGQYGIILFELIQNGIDPGRFGFENVHDFIHIIPSLKKCVIKNGKRVTIGTVLRVLPDANVKKNELHSVYVIGRERDGFVIGDETGIYFIDDDELYRCWRRAGMKYMQCKR